MKRSGYELRPKFYAPLRIEYVVCTKEHEKAFRFPPTAGNSLPKSPVQPHSIDYESSAYQPIAELGGPRLTSSGHEFDAALDPDRIQKGLVMAHNQK